MAVDLALIIVVGFLVAIYFAERSTHDKKRRNQMDDVERIEQNFRRRQKTGAGSYMFEEAPKRHVIKMLNDIRAISREDGSVYVKLKFSNREETRRVFVDSFRDDGYCFFGEIEDFLGQRKKDYYGVEAANVVSFFSEKGVVEYKL